MNYFEYWTTIPSFKEYEVSNLGRVRRRGTDLILSSRCSFTQPYPSVVLSVKGQKTGRTIRSLAAEAFLGPPPAGFVVSYKDPFRVDDHLENLCYVPRNVAARKGRLYKRSIPGQRGLWLKNRFYELVSHAAREFNLSSLEIIRELNEHIRIQLA